MGKPDKADKEVSLLSFTKRKSVSQSTLSRNQNFDRTFLCRPPYVFDLTTTWVMEHLFSWISVHRSTNARHNHASSSIVIGATSFQRMIRVWSSYLEKRKSHRITATALINRNYKCNGLFEFKERKMDKNPDILINPSLFSACWWYLEYVCQVLGIYWFYSTLPSVFPKPCTVREWSIIGADFTDHKAKGNVEKWGLW